MGRRAQGRGVERFSGPCQWFVEDRCGVPSYVSRLLVVLTSSGVSRCQAVGCRKAGPLVALQSHEDLRQGSEYERG